MPVNLRPQQSQMRIVIGRSEGCHYKIMFEKRDL